MAIEKLRTDFKDDILNASMEGKRQYNFAENSNGTVSLNDVSNYDQIGDLYGAQQINETNGTVNEIIDEIGNMEDGKTEVGAAASSKKLETARKINGVDFDGTKDIQIEDNTKLSLQEDFVIKEMELEFVNDVCTITDQKITSQSLADVYFMSDTYSVAEKAAIEVETYDGRVELTAGRPPQGIIRASIHIRVVK